MPRLADVLSMRHLPALDGLRAVAAFTVVIYHAGFAAVPGDLGVTAFFALSGFLITWLLLKEHGRTGTVSLRGFYLRRTLRIFPAYYAFVVASIAADWLLGDPWTAGQVATALSYTSNYYQATHAHSGPAAHSWSLAVEEQFYLLWPTVFLLLIRRGERALRIGILTLTGAVVLWRAYLYLVVQTGPHYVYNAFDTRFDAILMGCLLAVLCGSDRAREWLDRISCRAVLPALTLVALWYSRTQTSPEYHYAFGFTVDAALSTVLIIQLVRLSASRTWRWLDHPATRWLGAISYPIYLWHGWALTAAARLADGIAIRFVVGSGIAILVAAGSFYVIERPFLALKHRRERRSGRSPDVAPALAAEG